MVRMKALMVAVALGSAAVACGRTAASYQTNSAEPVADGVLVRVVNSGFVDVDVFAVSRGGQAQRLGTVTSTSNASFVLDPSYFPAGDLRLVATPIGGNGRASSGFLNVSAGETVEFDIAPRLGDSSAIIR